MIKDLSLLLAGAAVATLAWWLPDVATQHTDRTAVTVRLADLPHAGCWYEVYSLNGDAVTEPLCKG